MKTITCKQMGGPCDEKIKGKDFDEVMKYGMKHLEEAHPKMADDVKNTPKDDPMMKDWFENTKKLFDSLPEDEE